MVNRAGMYYEDFDRIVFPVVEAHMEEARAAIARLRQRGFSVQVAGPFEHDGATQQWNYYEVTVTGGIRLDLPKRLLAPLTIPAAEVDPEV